MDGRRRYGCAGGSKAIWNKELEEGGATCEDEAVDAVPIAVLPVAAFAGEKGEMEFFGEQSVTAVSIFLRTGRLDKDRKSYGESECDAMSRSLEEHSAS